MATKADSLDKQVQRIRLAFHDAMPGPSPMVERVAFWIREVFQDHVIAEEGELLWKVPFTTTEDAVTFAPRDEWEKVEQAFVPAKAYAVKAVGETDTHYLVEGYGAVWGGKDVMGDTFTKATELWLDKLSPTPPLMYHHGMDATIKRAVLGSVLTTKVDDVGLWVQAQIEKAQKYAKGVMRLVNKGMLGFSIGSAKHLVEKFGGHLKVWPMIELSLTPTPCEPRTLGVQALRSIAELEPAVKAYLPQGGGEPSADATKADGTDMSDNTGATDMIDKDTGTEAPVVETPEAAVKAVGISPEDIKQISDELMNQFKNMPNINFGATKAGPELDPETEDMDELKAYNEYLRFGEKASPEALKVVYQIGSETGGGYLQAPQQFVSTLIQAVDDQVFMRGLARKFQVPNAESLGAPSLDTDASDSDWTVELGTGSAENTLAFGKRELRPRPVAKRVVVSNTLIRKASGSDTIIMERLAYKLAVTQEKAFLTGDGSNQPLGVFTVSDNGLTTARDTTAAAVDDINADDIINVKYDMKPQYWPRLEWIMHRDVAKILAKIKDGESRPLWDNGGMNSPNGIRPLLNGFPVNMSEFAPNTISSGNYVAILGDFANYWIADSLSMTVQRLVELYAATNQTGFIIRAEMDGAPVLAEAFRRLILA